MEELYNELKKMMEGTALIQSEMATVKSVDMDKLECVASLVSNTEIITEEINLKAVVDGTQNGFVQVPKIGSIILISLIENTEGDHYVSMYSDISFLVLVQEGKEVFRVNSSGDITFHKGKISGLIDAKELKTQLDKNTQAIQKILDVFSGWTPVAQDGGVALKGQAASLAGVQLGDFSNIENEKVKH